MNMEDAVMDTEDDRIAMEAFAWTGRLAGDVSEDTARACAVWRAADPRHEQAFREAYRLAIALGRTETASGTAWRATAAARRRRAAVRRFAVPTLVAASVAAVVVVGMVGPWARPSPVTYATQVAKTERLDLADGSRVYVGAHSTVKVSVDKTRRRVELADGEAFFEVAKDPAHPFVVQAGDTTVRVLGTKFDVRRVGDDVRVSVLEGRVEVIRKPKARPAAIAAVLHPGEEVRVAPDVATPKVVSVSDSLPGAWRQGRLYYAEAPLRDVVADANRYRERPIRLASPDLGDLHVTTAFRTDGTEDLVRILETALPVRAESQSDGSVLLVRDGSRR
ncbi:MAG TPA: FecR domain-containing protein [Caulobacteraceae bacterium]|jgi:transmembrane sensor